MLFLCNSLLLKTLLGTRIYIQLRTLHIRIFQVQYSVEITLTGTLNRNGQSKKSIAGSVLEIIRFDKCRVSRRRSISLVYSREHAWIVHTRVETAYLDVLALVCDNIDSMESLIWFWEPLRNTLLPVWYTIIM